MAKIEFLYIGGQKQLPKCTMNLIKVGTDRICRSLRIKLLGIWTDQFLVFEYHVTQKCRTAMWNLYMIRNICNLLDCKTCHILVHSHIISHLDYANSVLYGTPDYTIKKLQRVQNIATQLVLQYDRYDSPKKALYELHSLLF